MIPSAENSDDKWLILDRAVKEALIVKLFEALRAKGVEPILIKGWAASRYYPDPSKRRLGDIDISVAPTAFAAARLVLDETGLSRENIDLHLGFRDRETNPWETLFRRSYLVDLNGTGIRVLGDEDHLRLIATHWLIDGGLNKERLWDIFYLVENRKPEFDWELCLESSGPHRKTWVLAAIASARDFLGLDVTGLPREIRDFTLPGWYVRAIEREWERGPYIRIGLLRCIRRPKVFFKQLHRRFPPNPIAATADTEGPVDDSARFPYQVRSIVKKLRHISAAKKIQGTE